MNHNQSSSSGTSNTSNDPSSKQPQSLTKFSGGSFGLVLINAKGDQTPSFKDKQSEMEAEPTVHERMSFSPRGSIRPL